MNRTISRTKVGSRFLGETKRNMCYEVQCSTCGKTTWGGCGWHVASVYKQIPEGQHCQCKTWPGVKPKSGEGNQLSGSTDDSKLSSFCTIL